MSLTVPEAFAAGFADDDAEGAWPHDEAWQEALALSTWFDDIMAAGGLAAGGPAAVVDAPGLDLALARKWTFVRAVDCWLGSDDGHRLGAACARIAAALA